jgi:UDP-N-acetylmuramoyl-tripeptide--D-alanyl-D-alanine ligase
MKLNLKTIQTICNAKIINPKDSISIENISIDTRTISEKNSLYTAIIGNKFDGHDFLLNARDKGACGYIVSKNITEEYALQNILIVNDTIKALQQIAAYYLSTLDVKPILITGSCGKTTVKDMLYHVLSSKFKVLATEKNLNNYLGVPLNIFRLKGDEKYCVLEVGINHSGEMDELASIIKPYLAIMTNIGKAHLQGFKNLDGVLNAKWEMTKYIKDNGFLVVNGDDKMLYEKTHNLSDTKYKIIKFGFNSYNDFKILSREYNNDSQKFKIYSKKHDKSWIINTKISGLSGVYNSLAVIAVSDCLDLDVDYVVKKLEEDINFTNMRFQKYEKNGVYIVNDAYNSNPTSLEQGLKNISEIKVSGRKIAVLGDMLELGDEAQKEHKYIGSIIKNFGIDFVFCYGELSKFIFEGALSSGFDKENIYHFTNKDNLVDKLKSIIKKDDLIFLKASRGMKLEEILEKL